EATPRGWMAEQTSWTKPGSVSSADRVPPPTVAAASTRRTERPARASVMAAARPLGPAPTTMASRDPVCAILPPAVSSSPDYAAGAPSHWLTRFVFLRLLGLVYTVAFLIV